MCVTYGGPTSLVGLMVLMSQASLKFMKNEKSTYFTPYFPCLLVLADFIIHAELAGRFTDSFFNALSMVEWTESDSMCLSYF